MSSAAAKSSPLSYQGSYLNFSTCFTRNVLLEQKMINSRNKCHFVENKTDIMQHDVKLQ